MNSIILPFDPNPSINVFSFWSNYLGILSGAGYDMRGVLYNNYITLIYAIAADHLGFIGGLRAKWSFRHKIVFSPPKDPIRFMEQTLSEKKYITIMLNSLHLSSISSNHEGYHDWLIYGYDSEERKFYAAGYVLQSDYSVFTYETIQFSYEDFISALPPKGKKVRKILLSWLPSRYHVQKFSLIKLYINLIFYAYNVLPTLFNGRVYPVFIKRFECSHFGNDYPFDLRPLKVLIEHKKLLLRMMAELVPDGLAIVEFREILNLAEKVLMVALKYNITGKNKQQKTLAICNALREIRNREPRILRRFFHELIDMGVVGAHQSAAADPHQLHAQ
ncbi:MAG: hypothetical protein LBJ11_06155 [Oscillospiraceae bacterium]|jgi:hypothetical protein|nr:hypothetical protein [Oscillospiraceae bacterium]